MILPESARWMRESRHSMTKRTGGTTMGMQIYLEVGFGLGMDAILGEHRYGMEKQVSRSMALTGY